MEQTLITVTSAPQQVFRDTTHVERPRYRNGALKNLYTILQAIHLGRTQFGSDDFSIIYVGASPFLASLYAALHFSGIQFILIDGCMSFDHPSAAIALMKKLTNVMFIEENLDKDSFKPGYLHRNVNGDTVCLHELSKRSVLLSDIRMTTDEKSIAADNNLQREWLIHSRCRYALTKFRPGYEQLGGAKQFSYPQGELHYRPYINPGSGEVTHVFDRHKHNLNYMWVSREVANKVFSYMMKYGYLYKDNSNYVELHEQMQSPDNHAYVCYTTMLNILKPAGLWAALMSDSKMVVYKKSDDGKPLRCDGYVYEGLFASISQDDVIEENRRKSTKAKIEKGKQKSGRSK